MAVAFREVSSAFRSALARGIQVRSKCTLKPPAPPVIVAGGWTTSTPAGGRDGYLQTPEPMAAPIVKQPDYAPDDRLLEPNEYKIGTEKAQYDAMLCGLTDIGNNTGERGHWGTYEDPVLHPSTTTEMDMECYCDGDPDLDPVEWTLYAGRPQRCPCGCVFKLFPVDRNAKYETRHRRPHTFTSPFQHCGTV